MSLVHISPNCMRRNAHEIFSRQDAKAFCDRVAQDSPKTVEDLVPKLLPLSSVQKVLQNLLREGSADSRWRLHSGSARRSRPEHEEYNSADRICSPEISGELS